MTRNVQPDYIGCPATVTEAVDRGVMLRPARWGIGDIVTMVVITVALALGGAALFKAIDAPLSVAVIGGGLLGWIGLAGWPIVATTRRGNGPRIDLGLRLTWSDVRAGVLGGVIALVVSGVVALLLVRFIGAFNSTAGVAATRLLDTGDRVAITIFALMILVGAPIVEEIAFRGLAFAALRKQGLSARLTIVISAVLFALVHIEPSRILVLLVIGLVLGSVRARTGSTGASMIAHAVVNAPGAVFLLLGAPGMTP